MFFSEEKNQKTFTSSAASTIEAWRAPCRWRQNQKSFASFLQKRRPSLPLILRQRIRPRVPKRRTAQPLKGQAMANFPYHHFLQPLRSCNAHVA
jgi:hypothetical protein